MAAFSDSYLPTYEPAHEEVLNLCEDNAKNLISNCNPTTRNAQKQEWVASPGNDRADLLLTVYTAKEPQSSLKRWLGICKVCVSYAPCVISCGRASMYIYILIRTPPTLYTPSVPQDQLRGADAVPVRLGKEAHMGQQLHQPGNTPALRVGGARPLR